MGALDHRGQRLVSWNEDALGVNAEISYKNVPFAWSPRGWGLFVNTPGRVTHGVGYPAWSHRSYVLAVEDEALDLFLIAAADPARRPRALHLAHRPPRPRPALEPGRLALPRLLPRRRRAAGRRSARARAAAADATSSRSTAAPGRTPQTRFAFEWDATRYPDPERVTAAVKAEGLRLCAWEYPLVSVHSRRYPDLAARGFFLKDASTGEPWLQRWDPAPFGGILTPLPISAILDFTNPAACAWWREQHEALFAAGVDVIKTDFGEQVPDDPRGLQRRLRPPPAQRLPAALQPLRLRRDRAPLRPGPRLRAAPAGPAASAIPIQWGGDPQTTGAGSRPRMRGVLSWAPRARPTTPPTSAASTVDDPDPELFVRWCQAAVFASHMRFHGMGAREPWAFGDDALALIRAALELRYRLIPYIERSLAESARTGLPLTRPMALAFPDQPESHAFDTQYLFGPDLLVAPVLAPGGRVLVWLPEGVWYDWATGDGPSGRSGCGSRCRSSGFRCSCGRGRRCRWRRPSPGPRSGEAARSR